MQQKPFWIQSEQPIFPMLRGRRNADAVVIGGGLSGLTTALWLCKSGLRVALLEARTLGSGASARCGGMVSLTGGLLYDRLEQKMGQAVVNAYAQTPVSYTHLDVYKRQAYRRCAGGRGISRANGARCAPSPRWMIFLKMYGVNTARAKTSIKQKSIAGGVPLSVEGRRPLWAGIRTVRSFDGKGNLS